MSDDWYRALNHSLRSGLGHSKRSVFPLIFPFPLKEKMVKILVALATLSSLLIAPAFAADDVKMADLAGEWYPASRNELTQLLQGYLDEAKPDPVVGLAALSDICKSVHKPVVAIGGITAENAGGVFHAGARSVAVISDLLNAPNIQERLRQY